MSLTAKYRIIIHKKPIEGLFAAHEEPAGRIADSYEEALEIGEQFLKNFGRAIDWFRIEKMYAKES